MMFVVHRKRTHEFLGILLINVKLESAGMEEAGVSVLPGVDE